MSSRVGSTNLIGGASSTRFLGGARVVTVGTVNVNCDASNGNAGVREVLAPDVGVPDVVPLEASVCKRVGLRWGLSEEHSLHSPERSSTSEKGLARDTEIPDQSAHQRVRGRETNMFLSTVTKPGVVLEHIDIDVCCSSFQRPLLE